MRTIIAFIKRMDSYIRPWECIGVEVRCSGMAQIQTWKHRRSGEYKEVIVV